MAGKYYIVTATDEGGNQIAYRLNQAQYELYVRMRIDSMLNPDIDFYCREDVDAAHIVDLSHY